ncbi:MAG: ABC transporter substrate-binding protein [Pseudomonadota bacterium]|nr:ABC transporter substrate-binding protein [Pseudomonadota bacterium]
MKQLKPYMLVTQLVVLLLCATPVYSDQSPRELVRDTSTQMLVTIRKEKSAIDQDQARLHELVAEIVLPHFDFVRMGRWTLGKHWRSASVQQRKEFAGEFRALLIRNYSNVLSEYADAEIDYLPFTMKDGDTRAKVHTELTPSNGVPVSIVYSLHRTKDDWKVYDVAVEGVSLVTNYRSSFASKIRKDGLDQLINMLAANNKEAGAS